MDFGYDLLVNPNKMKPYQKKTDIGLPEKNIELLGREQKPDLLLDMIEDDIVEKIPEIHTKIDNFMLREIIHLSIEKYKKIEKSNKFEIPDYLPFKPQLKRNIPKPFMEEPKSININPSNSNFDITKLH
jgi:hypothetical protein